MTDFKGKIEAKETVLDVQVIVLPLLSKSKEWIYSATKLLHVLTKDQRRMAKVQLRSRKKTNIIGNKK